MKKPATRIMKIAKPKKKTADKASTAATAAMKRDKGFMRGGMT